MPLSLDQFVTQITSSGLLSPEEVEQLRQPLQGVDAEKFARELVKQKKLTAFQAQQCYAGKGKSLALGNYVVLDKLGQGGMGMVLKAQHRRMKRLVAIKVLSPTVAKSPELVARFQREVEAAARLTHPNIVAAFDADESNGTVFLVMEYVEGKDLSTLVKSKKPLAVDRAMQCILQAAKGLEYAHKNGIIHRDIKPANLLMSNDGVLKILDMGLARIEGETGARAELTNTGAVMGTIDYMAPEQALNTKLADARSDIYSLGITLWYILVGRPVYKADSLMARLLAHRESPIPSLAGTRSGVPQALDDLFRKMVAKKPEDRCQSMTEVVEALEGVIEGKVSSPTITTLPSEESRFNEFLQKLADPIQSAAVSASIATRPTPAERGPDATFVSSNSDVATDPDTLLRLPNPKTSPTIKTSGTSPTKTRGTSNTTPSGVSSAIKSLLTPGTGWRDRRIQGAVGGSLLVVLLLLMILPGRKPSESGQTSPSVSEEISVARRSQGTPNAAGPSNPTLAAHGLISGSPLAENNTSEPRFALEFDGENDYVELPTDWQWDGQELTFEAWVIREELAIPADPKRRGFILFRLDHGEGASGTAAQLLEFVAPSNSNPTKTDHSLHLSAGHHSNVIATPAALSPGHLAHIAGVWRGTEMDLYVDGKSLTKQPFKYTFPARLSDPFTILGGTPQAAGGFRGAWKGKMVQARISSKALYNGNFDPPADLAQSGDTVALYKADQITGDQLTDLSGNNRHGRIVNARQVRIDNDQDNRPLAEAPASIQVPALEFDGVDDHISLPTDWPWDGKELTFEAWIVPADLDLPKNNASQSLVLFGLDQGADESRKIASFREHLFFNAEKETYVRELRGTVWPMADQSYRAHRSPMTISRLTHVAMMWKNGEISFFHNGRWRDGPKFGGKLSDREAPPYMQLGGVPHSTKGILFPWKGHLLQARITNRALYEHQFEPEVDFSSTPDTVALYKAGHVNGTTLTDLSGNNRHGTIHGPQLRTLGREIYTRPVDLMPLVRYDAPLRGNAWELKENGIETSVSDQAKTLITAEIPEEYDLHVTVTPLEGRHSLVMGLVTPKGRFWIPVSGWGDEMDGSNGFTRIEPRPSRGTGIAETPGRVLFTNKQSKLIFSVRTDGVKVQCDGKTLIDWHGNPQTLAEWPLWKFDEPGNLGIGAWRSKMRITRIELHPKVPASGIIPGVASALSASAQPSAAPSASLTLEPLQSLNSPIDDAYPWPTDGGRTLFFTREGPGAGVARTFMARRSGSEANFGNPTAAFVGRHAVVTDDLNYAVFLSPNNGKLHQTSRDPMTGQWGPFPPITSLANEPGVKSPWISKDGKTLVYQRASATPGTGSSAAEFVIVHRRAGNQAWGQPTRLPMSDSPLLNKVLTWPCLSDDLLRMVFCHGGDRQAEVFIASRSSVTEPFGDYRPLLFEGKPLVARAPRWSSAGDELFVSMDSNPAKPEWDLYVLKGLPPEYQAQPASGSNQGSQEGEGWINLFNGRDLTGWRQIGVQGWTVEDGLLKGRSAGERGWLMSEQEFGDFELQLEYRLQPNTNSGVFVRAWAEGHVTGGDFSEVQILDDTQPANTRLEPDRRTGALYGLLKAPDVANHGPNQWHTMTVTARGGNVSAEINGTKTIDGPLKPGTPERGSIGLQLYSPGIDFRAVRIRGFASKLPGTSEEEKTVKRPVLKFGFGSRVKLPEFEENWDEPLTMELWVYLDKLSDKLPGAEILHLRQQTLIGLGLHNNFGFHYQYLRSGGTNAGSGSMHHSPNNSLQAGEWYHVAGVRDRNESRLYLNGQLQSRRSGISPPPATASFKPVFQLGTGNNSTRFFDGQIASVRISRGSLYDENFQPPPMSLPKSESTALLYHMDEGQGNQLTDLSGQGRHGTIEGATWATASVPAELARIVETTPLPATRATLEFDGKDDYVDITSDWEWDGKQLTVDAWVIPEELPPTSHHYLFMFEQGMEETRRGVRFLAAAYARNADDPEIWREYNVSRPPLQDVIRVPRAPFAGNKPILLSIVWNGPEIVLYVDGQRQDVPTSIYNFGGRSTPPHAWIGAAQSGKTRGGIRGWKGKILQFRINSGVLYTENFQPEPDLANLPGTEGLYKFDEGQGDVLHDSSGNNRHGKIVGPTWAPLAP